MKFDLYIDGTHVGTVTEINLGTIARQPLLELPRNYLQAAELPPGIPEHPRFTCHGIVYGRAKS